MWHSESQPKIPKRGKITYVHSSTKKLDVNIPLGETLSCKHGNTCHKISDYFCNKVWQEEVVSVHGTSPQEGPEHPHLLTLCFGSWIVLVRFLSGLYLYAYLSVTIRVSIWQSLKLAFSYSGQRMLKIMLTSQLGKKKSAKEIKGIQILEALKWKEAAHIKSVYPNISLIYAPLLWWLAWDESSALGSKRLDQQRQGQCLDRIGCYSTLIDRLSERMTFTNIKSPLKMNWYN